MAAILSKLKEHAHNSSSGGFVGFIARVFIRFLQFVLALTVCGLYGQDLSKAQSEHKYADSKWVYAVTVAGISALTTLIYFVPLIKSWAFFAWDLIVFILWTVVFGIFGKMYIGEDPEGDAGITRMKHAVWVDVANMFLWFVTTVYGGLVFYMHRKKAGSSFTPSKV